MRGVTCIKKLVKEMEAGPYSDNRQLIKASLIGTVMAESFRGAAQHWINKDYLNSRIDHYKKNCIYDVRVIEEKANEWRLSDNPPKNYEDVRAELYPIFAQIDVNKPKDLKTLQRHIEYYYMRNNERPEPIFHAIMLVMTDMDRDLGLTLLDNYFGLVQQTYWLWNEDVAGIA